MIPCRISAAVLLYTWPTAGFPRNQSVPVTLAAQAGLMHLMPLVCNFMWSHGCILPHIITECEPEMHGQNMAHTQTPMVLLRRLG